MIFVVGVNEERAKNLLLFLRKQYKGEKVFGLDENMDNVNIMLRPYIEDEVKMMFEKHKPRVIVNWFEREKEGFDNYKYNVVPTIAFIKHMPKGCNFIYVSEKQAEDPISSFDYSKRQAENFVLNNEKGSVIRLSTKEIDDTFFYLVKSIIEEKRKGLYTL